ncbi:MAG: 4-alpha-glucanotransferase [Deltaproteobacteria bacterium]|nr:4-alpha-glucanotransferase [Deltaproteobacteria bacterium]
MRLPRASGLLLHPTSLPSRFGIGDFGPGATALLDFLAAARQRCWQVLPLGPTSFGDSPYQSPSTFAGNPLLVSLERLVDAGLLDGDALAGAATDGDPGAPVDYGAVLARKLPPLHAAARRLCGGGSALGDAFVRFRAAEAAWLDDAALFLALKDAHGGAPWSAWADDIRLRRAAALRHWRETLAAEIDAHAALQFLFFHQWGELRTAAAARGIRVIGDVPIFVAYDSADVWAHRDLFQLDPHGAPTAVAGVPPDYFSATGQLWGNPLYRWRALEADGFAWWVARLRMALRLYDAVRIDHFIGFTRYWAVTAGETTAINGQWRPAPGAAVLDAVRAALGEVAIVAENLGVVTPAVEALRARYDLPGMKVLQFAFDSDAANPFLPHMYARNEIVYTGTHDNDTTAGWVAAAPPATRAALCRYLGCAPDADPATLTWGLIRLAVGSVADTAIVPAQDVLGLGSDARMNLPGRAAGNWAWRLGEAALGAQHAERLAELTDLYGRAMDPPPPTLEDGEQ